MGLQDFYAAILAGGQGTRLWPHSRVNHPKQFADITGDGRTMIQATADRLTGLIPGEQIFVITGPAYAPLAVEQLPELPTANILVEPNGRNTAPAIGLACIHLQQRNQDAVIAVFPADHIISRTAAFQTALKRAIEVAQQGYLVTLGIEPTEPHTGYGYIKRAEVLTDAAEDESPVYAVAEFLEKPERAQAEAFLNAGGYYWNGGIFVSRVDVMLGEIRRQIPAMAAVLDDIGQALGTAQEQEVLAQRWGDMPKISIDYGIMENARRVAVTPLDAGWNDVGSWDALEGVQAADDAGNLIIRSDSVNIESQNNIIYGDGRMIALVGVEDLVVVDTGDALLIGHRRQMQKVKDVVEELKARKRSDLL